MRLPEASDLKSDSVKNSSIAGALAAVVATIQMLGSLGIVDQDVVNKALALPKGFITRWR